VINLEYQSIIKLLERALAEPKNLSLYIVEIQEIAWDKIDEDAPIFEVISDLAYDLEYFEPDPVKRSEDTSYFGEERAIMEIREALNRIREILSLDNNKPS
jgi:hypothetical protein